MNERYISPIHIYSRIKEEMRSYFFTGAIDDLMFSIWVRDCLDKFENTYLPLLECCMDLYDHKCELPCNFNSVREVWLTATIDKGPIVSPHVFYYQTDCRVGSSTEGCSACLAGEQCSTHVQQPVNLPSLCDVPPEYRVTNKVMTQFSFSFQVSCMLKPGNFRTMGRCSNLCANLESTAIDTFDIVGNKMVTSFGCGTVYMAYYANREPDPATGYYLIPDNDPFQKYVYYYLMFMVYQQLFIQATDETFNQIKAKRDDMESRYLDAYIAAKDYALAPEPLDMEKSIIRSYNRNNKFLIKGPATRR